MQIEVTAAQEAFIRKAIATGRLHRAEDAVIEALALWEAREHRRAEFLASLDAAESSIAAGQGLELLAESLQAIQTDIAARGRLRRAEGKQARA